MPKPIELTIERARRYLADVRAGHVSMTEPAAVVATLADYLGDLLQILDDQYLAHPAPSGERARIRAELLAEVPASQRAEGFPDADFSAAVATTLVRIPGDIAQAVTGWLRAARQEASNGTPPPLTYPNRLNVRSGSDVGPPPPHNQSGTPPQS